MPVPVRILDACDAGVRRTFVSLMFRSVPPLCGLLLHYSIISIYGYKRYSFIFRTGKMENSVKRFFKEYNEE